MRTKKTIEVARITALINKRLADKSLGSEARKALETLASIVLRETGNYRGFGYPALDDDAQMAQLKAAQAAGDFEGIEAACGEVKFFFCP